MSLIDASFLVYLVLLVLALGMELYRKWHD